MSLLDKYFISLVSLPGKTGIIVNGDHRTDRRETSEMCCMMVLPSLYGSWNEFPWCAYRHRWRSMVMHQLRKSRSSVMRHTTCGGRHLALDYIVCVWLLSVCRIYFNGIYQNVPIRKRFCIIISFSIKVLKILRTIRFKKKNQIAKLVLIFCLNYFCRHAVTWVTYTHVFK